MKMKISEIKQYTTGSEPRKTKPVDAVPGEFTRLLAEESGKMDETIKVVRSGMEPVTLPSVKDYLPAGVGRDFSNEYHKAELGLEGTINRLEKLQLALLDLKGGLKPVGAAIENLTAGAGELQESVAELPENHLLRQMADELSIIVHVESIKYRRGDYL
jgi:hypothetical protein